MSLSETDQVFLLLKEVERRMPSDAKLPGSDLEMPNYRADYFWGAKEVINLLLYLAIVGLNPIQEEEIRNYFLLKAQVRDYQGQWKLVAELCLEETFAPVRLLTLVLREEGPHSFFGNRVQSLVSTGKKVRWRPQRFTEKSRTRRSTHRKRGHDSTGKMRHSGFRLPPGRKLQPSLDQEIQSIHTLFLGQVLTRFRKPSKQRDLVSTAPREMARETDKLAQELFDRTLGTVEAMERILETKVPYNRRRLRAKARKAIKNLLAADAARVERNALLQLEPVEALKLQDDPAQRGADYALDESYCLLRLRLEAVCRCFGFYDLEIPSTDQHSSESSS